MSRRMLPLFVMLFVGCSRVSEDDARKLLEGVETIATVEERDMHTVLLGSMCMELQSCGGKCTEILGLLQNAPSEMWTSLVAQSCDANAASLPKNRDGFDRWLDGWVDAYVKRARIALPEPERARLDSGWAKVRPIRG